MEWLKKNEYAKTVILLAVIVVGVVGFQLGLRAALRTSYPLAAVESGSMIPTLRVGDIISVRGGLNFSEVEFGPNPDGDILVFKNPYGTMKRVYWFFKAPELIVHRAVDKKYEDGMWYFRTQGDKNPSRDSWPDKGGGVGWVPETLVIGKVVGRIPLLGHIPLFLQTDAGMILIVGALFALIVIDFVIPPLIESLKSKNETKAYKEPPQNSIE